MPDGVIAAIPALEEFGIASRLASESGLPGCYDGTVTQLVESWVQHQDTYTIERIVITTGGDDPTFRAMTILSRKLNVPATNISTRGG